MWTAAIFNLRKQDSGTAVVSGLPTSSGPVKPVLLFFPKKWMKGKNVCIRALMDLMTVDSIVNVVWSSCLMAHNWLICE